MTNLRFLEMKRGTPRIAIVLLLLIGACVSTSFGQQGAGQLKCDCSKPISLKRAPVCGEDGLTYVNECVAQCQQVVVAKRGACPHHAGGNDPASFAAGTVDDAATVDLSTLTRFTAEGYKFVHSRKHSPSATVNEPQGTDTTARPSDAAGAKPANAAQAQPTMTARITPDGSVYAKEVVKPAHRPTPIKPIIPQHTAAAAGATRSRNPGGRKLRAIIGTDDRVPAFEKGVYPWTAVGQVRIGGGTPTTQKGTCSGSLMGSTTVLTAGHCVLDVNNGFQAYDNWFYCPDLGNDQYTAGCAPVAWAETPYLNAATDRDNLGAAFDIAVLRLALPVPTSTYGTLGLELLECMSSAPYPTTVTVDTAGYPSDKDFNRYRQQGQSIPFFHDCRGDALDGWGVVDDGANVLLTDIDVIQGQSGSAVWEPTKNVIRAIIVEDVLKSTGPRTRVRTIQENIYNWLVTLVE